MIVVDAAKRSERLPATGQRNAGVDYLKIGLAIMVVGLHTNVFLAVSPAWDWLTANGLFRMAVPCFLVINGYYFGGSLDKRQWFKRVFRLYGVWAVLYIPFLLTAHHTLEWKFLTFLAGYSHLWYLPAMLMAGGLVEWCARYSPRVLIIAAAGAFMTGFAVSLAGQLHPEATEGAWAVLTDVWASRNGVLFGFPLFACGYLLQRYGVVSHVTLRACVWMLGASLLLLLAESWVFHLTAPARGGVDVYLSIMLVGPLAFLTASRLNLPGPGKFMSRLASGIYFSHFGLLILLHWFGLSGFAWFFATLISATLSALVLMVLNRGRWGII